MLASRTGYNKSMRSRWQRWRRGLLIGVALIYLLVVFIASRWRIRWAVVGLVIVAVVAGGFLLRQGRGLTWVDLKSPEAVLVTIDGSFATGALFAATHPRRTSALVVLEGYAATEIASIDNREEHVASYVAMARMS